MLRFCVGLFFYVACFCHSAMSMGFEVLHTRLDNGMEVYVIPNKAIPVVMHVVLYKVGGVDDPTGYSGLAHFFEHLMFSGTNKFKDFTSVVNNIGAEFNAETSNYYTAYHELVQKQYLPLVMEIEADRMRNLKLTDKAMNRERKVVLEERKMRTEGSPRNLLYEKMYNTFYRNGYARPVVGWEHEIKNFNKRVSKDFYRDFYNPNNAILLVSGDVDFDNVVELSKKYYGNIKNHNFKKIRSPAKLEPPHVTDVIIKLEDTAVKEPELFILYKAPSVITNSAKDCNAIMLATDILGGGKFGLLYNELVLKKSLAVNVSAVYESEEYSHGNVMIAITPKHGISLQVIEDEVNKIISKLTSVGISEELLDQAKYRTIAHMVYSLDGISAKAMFYVTKLALNIPLLSMQDIINGVKSIDVQHVNLMIKEIFAGRKLSGHLLPKKGEDEKND